MLAAIWHFQAPEARTAGAPRPRAWVRGPVRARVRTALVTAVGYYGNASALVMRAASS
jgi:hypothetical protein